MLDPKRLAAFTLLGVLLLAALLLPLTQITFAAPPPAPFLSLTNPPFNPHNFVLGVNNPYMPLIPRTLMIYEGQTEKGNEHNEVLVKPETKLILGVTCVIVQDNVLVDDELAEATVDWYAQDKQGNVWYMGEDTAEYENGKIVSTEGSWEAGVNGAVPGIIMQAHPEIGDTYRQEYLQGEAEDMARVLSLTKSAQVAYGSFKHLLMTKEWTPLEPGIVEHKFYARGIGFILTRGVKGDTGTLELISIQHPR